MTTNPNCKINLGLHVTHKREDGYHDLETIFLPVPLCDTLTIREHELNESFEEGDCGVSFCTNGRPIDGDANDNLVVKAFRLLKENYSNKIGSPCFTLTKNIPMGAGLGGGSSDAAFALKMLNTRYNLNISDDTLKLLAAKLGADCPFFIDNVPSYATGIGDKLSPLGFNPLEGYTLIMVKPHEAVSTAEAYRGITPRDRRQTNNEIHLPTAAKRPITEWKELIVNDFEETVFRSHPRLAQLKEAFYNSGALYAAMSGSGATVYGIFDKEKEHDNTSLKRFGETWIFLGS